MGVNLGMKKYWYVVVLAVSLFLLGACVTDTTPPPPSYPDSVSDLEEIPEDLSVVTVLTDDEVQALITDVSDYVAAQESESEPDPTSILKSVPELMSEPTPDATEVKGYYNGLMNVFHQHSAVEAKLRNMVKYSKGLVGVTSLEVEITGTAKEEIIDALNALFEPDETIAVPDTLILDYRDFMYLRALAGGLLAIYDSEEPVNDWFDNLDEIIAITDYFETGESPENLFKAEALGPIESFVEYLNTSGYEYPFEEEETWTELDKLVTGLAGIAAPTDELNMADIFADGILQIGGMDFLVNTLDSFVEIINGVYVFEVENTDDNGWRKDDKTSLFEYAMKLSGENSEDDISIKTDLGEDISVEDMPAEITELKFEEVDLLEGAKWADLLGELNEVLDPDKADKLLDITTKASTSIQSEGSGEIPVTVSGFLGVDFGALSSDGNLALLKNNLGVEADIIDELIAIEIWTIIATPEPTPEQIGEIIGIILDNITFIEKEEYSLGIEIDIDNSISEEVTIETDEITIDELIVEFIAASMQPL